MLQTRPVAQSRSTPQSARQNGRRSTLPSLPATANVTQVAPRHCPSGQGMVQSPRRNAAAHPEPGLQVQVGPVPHWASRSHRPPIGTRIDANLFCAKAIDVADVGLADQADHTDVVVRRGACTRATGARSSTGAVPSPKVHLKRVSSGEPTGANETVSGAGPEQTPPSGSY